MQRITTILLVFSLMIPGALYSQVVQRTSSTLAASAIPTVSSFSPTSGPIGTSVTITGTNFSTTPANDIVYFGAVRATVTSATSTSLGVTVPTGATYMPITVTVDGLTAYSSAPFTITFAGGGSITSETFAPKVDFTTGVSPYGVAISDLDGDGKSDLATANFNSNTVSVFMNTSSSGSVTFASRLDFATGVQPVSVMIGDVDGDGKPDLAVGNNGSNTISVFRNTSTPGSIAFASKVDLAVGVYPWNVAIGDLDGDGKSDLAVGNFLSNTVSVFRNTSTSGSVTFDARIDFATEVQPFGVVIGDMDGDAKPDLIVGNNGSNTISVFRNTSTSGAVTFSPKVSFATEVEPFGVAIADVDGDGNPDVAVGNVMSNTVSVFRNTSALGSIAFAAKVDLATGVQAFGVAFGDLDGDGKPDLAVGSNSTNTVSAFRNISVSGSIAFAPKAVFATGVQPLSIAIGDVDRDGKPDIVVANSNGDNTVSVFRNTISAPIPTTTSNTATNLTATSAMLGGSVNPNGSATTAYFEWGTSSSLATVSTTASQSIGSGTDAVLVTANLAGLGAGTTYYYRAVGQNSAGTQRGSILSFTTLTLQQQAQLIIGQVGVLVSGAVLNQGQGNALTSKLNAAIQQINKENLNAAINQLGAFVNQVEGLVKAGKISSADGGVLISSANMLIAQLSSPASQGVQSLESQASGFEVPTQFLLEQNYPNPFNPSTMISFSLPSKSHVSLRVFDAMGREVATLVSGELAAGNHSRRWNATGMPSGAYFYRISAGPITETKRLVLLR